MPELVPPRSRARRAPLARRRWRVAASAILAVAGCLEYSPHELPEDGSQRDLHRKAVEVLAARPPGETFRFVAVGDTQRAFEATEEFIEAVNQRDDLAFVIQVGDFTNFGLSFEYEAMQEIFAKLRVPFFVALGNHDLLANGGAIYERMFGPRNFAFTYGGVRFVLLDANSREYGFPPGIPDLAWLDAQLAPDGLHDRAIVLSHCGTLDTDFREDLKQPFRESLAAGGAMAIHAHSHSFREWEEEGVRMYRADSAEHGNYLLVTVAPEGIQVERVFF